MKFSKFISLLAPLTLPATAFAQTTVVGGVGPGGWFFGIGSGAGAGGFAACSNTICYLAEELIYFINNVAVPVVFALAFIVFLWGVADTYILSGGDETKVAQGHKLILYGIIGFVVMISVWGLVNVASNTFGLSGAPAPQYPTSPSTPY